MQREPAAAAQPQPSMESDAPEADADLLDLLPDASHGAKQPPVVDNGSKVGLRRAGHPPCRPLPVA